MKKTRTQKVYRLISNYKKTSVAGGLIFLSIIICLCVILNSVAPLDYPQGSIISIKKDMTVSQAADLLMEKRAISSAFMYKVYVKFLSGKNGVIVGDYLLYEPESALRLAYRTTRGINGLVRIKVTIPEGLASSDIARLLAKSIPNFDSKTFAKLAKPLEGYLFPDTYFFYQTTTPQEVIDAMRANFDTQTKGLRIPPTLKNVTFKDAIIMASIVEEEARGSEDQRIIAGILWKRLALNMPLQVDPPFFYILGKTSAELTRADLATTSPYNLYVHRGLPPTPIDNPGLGAIKATLEATSTEYYFFLAGDDGTIHYAKTYDMHLTNKAKYID
jgi:UPF0755 protein